MTQTQSKQVIRSTTNPIAFLAFGMLSWGLGVWLGAVAAGIEIPGPPPDYGVASVEYQGVVMTFRWRR